MKYSFHKIMFAVVVVMAASAELSAQPTGLPTPTPFGFTEVLIGAGLLYGGRKAYKARAGK